MTGPEIDRWLKQQEKDERARLRLVNSIAWRASRTASIDARTTRLADPYPARLI